MEYTPCQAPLSQTSSSQSISIPKQSVFLSIHAWKKNVYHIYVCASIKIYSSVSCILNIYVSGGILYLSFCNLLFSLNILFLRIIHVDADRKLNIILGSENIPAHWRNLVKSPRYFVDIPGSYFSFRCFGQPSSGCWLNTFLSLRLGKLGLVDPLVLTVATHRANWANILPSPMVHPSPQSPGTTVPDTKVPNKPIVCCQMRKSSHTSS